MATFSVADAILFLSALGFLGLGILPPQTDWGTMLQNGTAQISNGYWWEIYPLAIVFILVVVSHQLHRRRAARHLRGSTHRALTAHVSARSV